MKKVKVCKLISQRSSRTLFMGAKSSAKSLETFTFDNNRAIWSKRLQTFCVANVAEESCTAEIIPVRERRSPRQSREGGPTRGLSTWNRRGDSGYGSSKSCILRKVGLTRIAGRHGSSSLLFESPTRCSSASSRPWRLHFQLQHTTSLAGSAFPWN